MKKKIVMQTIKMYHVIREPGRVEKELETDQSKSLGPTCHQPGAASIVVVDMSCDLFWFQDFHLQNEMFKYRIPNTTLTNWTADRPMMTFLGMC